MEKTTEATITSLLAVIRGQSEVISGLTAVAAGKNPNTTEIEDNFDDSRHLSTMATKGCANGTSGERGSSNSNKGVENKSKKQYCQKRPSFTLNLMGMTPRHIHDEWHPENIKFGFNHPGFFD